MSNKKKKKIAFAFILICITFSIFLFFNNEKAEASESLWTDAKIFYLRNTDTPKTHNNCIYVCKRASTASGTGYRIFTLGFRLNISGTDYYVDLGLEKGYSNGKSITLAGKNGQVKLVDEVDNDDGYTYSLYKINYNEMISVVYERLGENVVDKYFANTTDENNDTKLQIDSIMTAIYWNSGSSYELKCDIAKCNTNKTTFTTGKHYTYTSSFESYYTGLNPSTTIKFSDLFDFDFTLTISSGAGVYPTNVKYYLYNETTKEYKYWYKEGKKSYVYGKTVTQDTSAPDGYVTKYYDNKKYTIEFDWKYYFEAYDLSCAYDKETIYQKWVVNGQNKIKICDLTTLVYLRRTAPEITTVDKSRREGKTITDKWLVKNITARDDIDGDISDDIIVAGYGGIKKYMDCAKAGEYTIKYKVTNSGGRIATKTATVTISNALPEIITVDKVFDYGNEMTDKFLLKNITASDAYDGDITESIIITDYGGIAVNSTENDYGKYTITYSVTDSNGATVTATADITIVYRYIRSISSDTLDTINFNSRWQQSELSKILKQSLKIGSDENLNNISIYNFTSKEIKEIKNNK